MYEGNCKRRISLTPLDESTYSLSDESDGSSHETESLQNDKTSMNRKSDMLTPEKSISLPVITPKPNSQIFNSINPANPIITILPQSSNKRDLLENELCAFSH